MFFAMPSLATPPLSLHHDFTLAADELRVCANPHKGWYLHHFDNGLARYGALLDPQDRLLDFPGLSTLYLRIPWCELEPEEGRFAWHLIDEVADAWLPTGRTLAFCVSCKETDRAYPFATPAWVREAGARGSFIPSGNGEWRTWEPDYGDPVFLAKLEAFHLAFAARYDGRPWVEWITVGSYGDWGEGHTCASSRREWPVEVIRRHLDLYRRCYPLSRIEANDDLVGSRLDRAGAEELRRHIDECGFALTDHGVCVDWFARHFGPSTLRDASWLARASERAPVVLELEHYHITRRTGNWKDGAPLRLAIEETRATYAGFHGCARTWLGENADYARQVANLLGYWLFLHEVEWLAGAEPGDPVRLRVRWQNRGVAPLYHAADLVLRLQPVSGAPATACKLREIGPAETPPGRAVELRVELERRPEPGAYRASLGLVDRRTAFPVRFAIEETRETPDGFVRLDGASWVLR